MAFIKITNDAECVNRIFLEKLGISTKRDDESTIGQFGSGSKFAPIAALRNGWRWINVGADNNGQYSMEYVVEDKSGYDCVGFLYDGVTLKESSFTLGAGELSWDESFQIFREAFANALDEKIAFDANYSITVVDDVYYEPGKFSVFLTAAPELMAIVDEFNKFFCIERKPIYSCSYGTIYEPYDNEVNIYYKGVLVNYGMNRNNLVPIFDYEFKNITLNEERRLRHFTDVDQKLISLWGALDRDEDAYGIVYDIVKLMNSSRWEVSGIADWMTDYFYSTSDSNFRRAFVDLYGDTACICPPSAKPFLSHIKMRGYTPVIVENPLMLGILEKAGVINHSDVLGDSVEFDFCKLKPGLEKKFSKAMEIVSNYDNRINSDVRDFKFFNPRAEQDAVLGVAKNSDIYLSIQAFRNMHTLVGTLIHELDHIVSGYTDTDAAFRCVADDRIADLVIRFAEMEG